MVALIQVRSTSTRLPGKYKEAIGPLSITEIIYNTVSSVIPHTLCIVPEEDIEIQDFLDTIDVPWMRGPFEPLLRYFTIAKRLKAHTVIRITGDCPLVEPYKIKYLTELHERLQADFTSNCHPDKRTEIDGLDIEIMSARCLSWLNEFARGEDREHVTAHLYKNPRYAEREKLRCVFWKPPVDLYHVVKLSIDTKDDLDKVRSLCPFVPKEPVKS